MSELPRRFRILDELDEGIKGVENGYITYGLVDSGDDKFLLWRASIVGPLNTVYENNIYELILYCGDKYPDKEPNLKFSNSINLSFVDKNGNINKNSIKSLKYWNSSIKIKDVLIEIRNKMANDKNKYRKQD